MNRKHKISIGLILSSLALSALPAGAVSLDSFWFATRSNTVGTTFAVLPPHANHFCFLSKVEIEETDTGGEFARCEVRQSGTVWLLEAVLGRSSDADARCEAICYNN